MDRLLECGPQGFADEVCALAVRAAGAAGLRARIGGKKAALAGQQARRPPADHREAERALMREAFFEPRAPYHALRAAFVRKEPPPYALPVPRTAGSGARRSRLGPRRA